jgi:hypothetical protein
VSEVRANIFDFDIEHQLVPAYYDCLRNSVDIEPRKASRDDGEGGSDLRSEHREPVPAAT